MRSGFSKLLIRLLFKENITVGTFHFNQTKPNRTGPESTFNHQVRTFAACLIDHRKFSRNFEFWILIWADQICHKLCSMNHSNLISEVKHFPPNSIELVSPDVSMKSEQKTTSYLFNKSVKINWANLWYFNENWDVWESCQRFKYSDCQSVFRVQCR